MKKIYSFMVATVAMFAAVSCNKELVNEQDNLPAGETVVYTASVDGAETKAALNADGNKSEWVAGDAITVLDGDDSWEFTTEEGGANVEFSNSEDFGEYRPVMAVYPKGEYSTVNISDKTVKAYIPTWQQAQVGTYHSPAALAVAYSENSSFAFKNAHALLKFTVNTDNVTHVIFHGNNSEAITGDVNVTLGAEGVSDVECLETVFTENDGQVTKFGTWVECYAYHDAENRYFAKGQTYYIAVAPQKFNGGVTVKVKINEGGELVAKTTSKPVETKINTILDLGEIKYEAPAVDYWGLIGTMADSAWATDLVLEEEGDYLVYKDVTLTTTDEFKFRKNGLWEEQKIAKGGLAAANTEYDLVDAGSSNMKVSTAGTYDIYLKKDLSKVYCMETGKTPDQAIQPDLSNTYRFYVQNNVGWSTLNFYAWGGYISAGWPGDKMTDSANVEEYGTCKYIEIQKGVSVVNFIINNGSKQTKDLKVSGNSNVKTLSNGDMIYILTDSDVKK